jgi:hypothetical protein
MSCRGITEGWKLSPSPQRPEGYSDVHPTHVIGFDSSPPAASCCVAAPVSCGIAEPLRSGTHQCVFEPAATHANAPRAELVEAQSLFASLVWHQVRPRDRSTSDARPRIGSPHGSKALPVMVGAPELGSPCPRGAARPAAIMDAALPDPFPASIETLFSQLARRRLHSLAAREES